MPRAQKSVPTWVGQIVELLLFGCRRRKTHPGLPVLLMSAEAGMTGSKAIGLGATTLFSKPVSAQSLLGTIDQLGVLKH